MDQAETFTVTKKHCEQIQMLVRQALEYEIIMQGKRKAGITGEVGEILVAYELGLSLSWNPRQSGFDAIDKDGNTIQIKTRRSENTDRPNNSGVTSKFGKHSFKYALLAILNRNYELTGIWKITRHTLLEKLHSTRRTISIGNFIKFANNIYKS